MTSLKALRTSGDGLANYQVQARLQTFGFNEVAEKRKNPAVEFLLRYWGGHIPTANVDGSNFEPALFTNKSAIDLVRWQSHLIAKTKNVIDL
jgi:hypothetical protein